MLGFYRYILAMMVACSHLWHGIMWWQGTYAVFSFYIVSGYLMSFIINKVYVGKHGTWRYLANRVLRIYPLYLVTFFLAVLFLILVPDLAFKVEPDPLLYENVMPRPQSMSDWIGNLTLLTPLDRPLTISVGWSLRVELVFYVLMIGLSRRFWIVCLWVALSSLYVGYMTYNGVIFIELYTSVLGASFPFSLGALIYYIRQKKSLALWHLPLAAILFFAHLWFAPEIWGFERDSRSFAVFYKAHHYGLFMAASLSAYLMWAITSQRTVTTGFQIFGTHLGKLAYAVFLVHWLVTGLIAATGVSYFNKPLFIPLAFVGINFLSLALYTWIEKPINMKVRDRVRAKTMM